jgi:hypothetical protein
MMPGRTATPLARAAWRTARIAWLAWTALAVSTLFASCSRPPEGGPLTVRVAFGEPGSSPGQFGYPRAIESDSHSLWVIDKLARVQRLDAQGNVIAWWTMPKFDRGKPCGLAAWSREGDEHMLLFIADTHEHRVVAYRQPRVAGAGAAPGVAVPPLDNTPLAAFGSFGNDAGQFVYPTDIALLPTPDGGAIARLYVSEYGGNDRVSIWEPSEPIRATTDLARVSFACVATFGRFGASASPEQIEFNRPQALAIDASPARGQPELLVVDACNHRVGRFTLDGALLAWFGDVELVGGAPGRFSYPYGIALPGDGTGVISEFGNARVQRIDLASGVSLGLFGEHGRGPGQLATPWGVAMLDERVYVLDSGNNRIQAFDRPRGSRPLASADHREPGASGGPR